jgi:hypothetical protein
LSPFSERELQVGVQRQVRELAVLLNRFELDFGLECFLARLPLAAQQ